MSEEFKPIRITLSDEAFDRMNKIMKNAKFRSASATIEECVRVVDDIIEEIHAILGTKEGIRVNPSALDRVSSWNRILMRLSRFTGWKLAPKLPEEKANSAGP